MKSYKFSDIAYNITEKKIPDSGDEKLYIGLEHLDSGSLYVTRWGGDIELKGEKLIMRKGDILFGRRNTYLRRASIAPHDGIFSAHGMIFRPKTDVVDSSFFPFFIASDYFMNEAIRISVGSLSPTVNWGTLKNLEFILPDIPQQKQYAKLLWAFEQTKEAYKRLIISTDDLVKSQFVEMFGDTNNNPKKLDVKKWEDVFITTTGKLDSNAMVEGGQYPFFTCAKEIFQIDKYAFDCEALLLAGNNAVGVYDVKHYKGKFNAYQRTYVLQLQNGEWSYEFFKNQLELKLEYLREHSIGTNTRYLTLKILDEIDFLVPDIAQQQEWTNFIQQTDKSKLAAKKALDDLTSAQKALMRQCLG